MSFDTAAVVINVTNYYPEDVAVYVEVRGEQVCIGKVPAQHQALFVLPSEQAVGLSEFTVAVTQVGEAPWRTEQLRRQPGRMSRVWVWVGPKSGKPEVATQSIS